MPLAGGDSMLTMTAQGSYTNMGAMLSSDMGYYGMAFHDNDDLYYSRNITHNLLGYSEGFMGFGNGMEKLISRAWPESDLEMMQGTLPLYTDHQPNLLHDGQRTQRIQLLFKCHVRTQP